MKLQQLFDDVSQHLLTQGEPARTADGECVYRSKDGLTCPVGELIPDRLYDSLMERKTVSELLDIGVFEALRTHLTAKYDVAVTEFDVFVEALGKLQLLHDNIRPDQWPVQLKAFAKDYGLSTNL